MISVSHTDFDFGYQDVFIGKYHKWERLGKIHHIIEDYKVVIEQFVNIILHIDMYFWLSRRVSVSMYSFSNQ